MVGEPGLRIDVIHPRGDDQRVHHRRLVAAAVGAGEQSGPALQRNTAQRSFGGIVGQADTAVVEEPGKARPALEHVVHGLFVTGIQVVTHA